MIKSFSLGAIQIPVSGENRPEHSPHRLVTLRSGGSSPFLGAKKLRSYRMRPASRIPSGMPELI